MTTRHTRVDAAPVHTHYTTAILNSGVHITVCEGTLDQCREAAQQCISSELEDTPLISTSSAPGSDLAYIKRSQIAAVTIGH
ncbi:hypothetical protein [Corynebacterium heidelbergense]|uniref:hypothetical protein n=1 Tax=Corynebacterium heidelbergense TaxID=2055947 RepID=UPI0011BE8F04|nr:hypothetical protein [Corynebacterium heidelbergense]WCZ36050.1 hypothetical protein CHEID_02420 [Corynebacterium heidelbergense]